eukprot:gene3759-4281_t
MEGNGYLLQSETYKKYKRRWFMLFVVIMFNFSNAMTWITYASIANIASVYYDVSEDRINWFSTVFFLCSVIVGLPAFWVIDNMGLRTGMVAGTAVNALGSVIRMLASLVVTSKYRFWVALFGQIIAASSQPLVLPMPTKVAAVWFGENERTTANTIAFVANPIGVLVASAIAPAIAKQPSDIKLLMIIFTIPAVLAAFLALVGVCSSFPPTPPSASAHIEPQPFFDGLKKALKKKSYLILMLVFGFGVAAFSTITSLLQQIICVNGYNNDIAGLCGALVIVGGLLFSAIAGVYVDKTKKFEETAKIMIILASLGSALVLISTSLVDQTVFLCISFLLFGMAMAVAPLLLELGVECTYPVAEATSSGFQWLLGQLIGVVLMFCIPLMGKDLTDEEKKVSKCNIAGSGTTIKPMDMTYGLILLICILEVLVIIFVFAFKTEFLRLNAERKKQIIKDILGDEPLPVSGE